MAIETTILSGFPKIGDTTEEQKLRRSLHQFDKGELSAEELEEVKNDVTCEAIQIQINAGVREHGLSYSKFIFGLKNNKIELDRKMLSDLAQNNPDIFKQIVETAKS